MKVNVKNMSQIQRYEARFSSLSAFFLASAPSVADTENLEETGNGVMESLSPLSFHYRTEEGHPCAISLDGDTLTVKRGFSEMRFTKGTTTTFIYRTGYGEIETEAFTDGISLAERGGKWLLSLSYYARMGDVMQKNSMRFILTPTV